MRIEIGLGNAELPSSFLGFQKSIDSLFVRTSKVVDSFQQVKNFVCTINGGIGSLQDAVDKIDARIQEEENLLLGIQHMQRQCEDFLSIIHQVDNQVAELVNNNKEEFYELNPWSRPGPLSLNDMVSSSLKGISKIFERTLKGIDEYFQHTMDIYRESNFSEMTDEQRKAYYEELIKRLNSSNISEISNDDRIRAQSFLDYLSRTTVREGMSEEDKQNIEMYNHVYEKLHPEDAKSLDTFFGREAYNENGALRDGITEEDIANIKYIAYHSDSPCHDIFFHYIEECHVGSWNYVEDGEPNAFYRSGKTNGNGVYMNLVIGEDGIDCPKGAYNTFFHEIGHHIDDLMSGSANDGKFFTIEEVANGDFYNVIHQDVENDFRKSISDYNDNKWIKLSENSQQKILDVMMGRKNVDELNFFDRQSYQKISDEYRNNKLSGDGNDQISDIYGGITNNQVEGDWGHSQYLYWRLDNDGKNILENREIIGRDTIPTHKQEKEFFAEYFSYQMTKDSDEGNARHYLPESYRQMDEATKKRAEEIRKASHK